MNSYTKISKEWLSEKKISLNTERQFRRRVFQTSFFLLFIFTPVLDIFRFDLNLGHFILFGQNLTLGLGALMAGESSAVNGVLNIITRVFFPLISLVVIFGWVSWKYGRLYCGWLCPHFSVVEMVNSIMRKASGKLSIWDKKKSIRSTDGSHIETDKKYWPLVFMAVIGFAFLWAVVFLTYLLPPEEIYSNLFSLSLTRNQMLFIGAATFLLSIEFMFARHLFCRFACAVGVFQSLVWMANKRAMVVSFDRENALQCQGCHIACEDECPMRLKPRSIKRYMFNCTECGRCLNACEQVQLKNDKPSLLTWQDGQSAFRESDR